MDDMDIGSPRARHIYRGYTTVVLTALIALAGWLAIQFVDVRDNIREIRATVPIQIAAINQRIGNNERRLDAVDTRFLPIEASLYRSKR